MKTLFSIVLLIILGVIAKFIIPFVLTVVSLPGRFIAFPGDIGKRSKIRILFGTLISIVTQSYVYLAYTTFVVNWTMLAISKQGVSFIIWPIAFLVVVLPIWFFLNDTKTTAKKIEHTSKGMSNRLKGSIAETQMFSMLAQSLLITSLLTLTGFFIFAFIPNVMEIIYNWVPYIGS